MGVVLRAKVGPPVLCAGIASTIDVSIAKSHRTDEPSPLLTIFYQPAPASPLAPSIVSRQVAASRPYAGPRWTAATPFQASALRVHATTHRHHAQPDPHRPTSDPFRLSP